MCFVCVVVRSDVLRRFVSCKLLLYKILDKYRMKCS